jgi:hypothetical protein
MATFTDRLMGEVIDNPETQERDVELLLLNLLHCLLEEQHIGSTANINSYTASQHPSSRAEQL